MERHEQTESWRESEKKINKGWTRESGGNQLRLSIIGDVGVVSALIEV